MSTSYQQHSLFGGEQHAPVTTTASTHTQAVKHTQQTRAACANDCHEWRPTFRLGEQLCLRCHLRASCPDCLSFPPARVPLRSCARHGKKEEDEP